MHNTIDSVIKRIKKNNKKGNIIVISGPSGSGKTTICKKLIEKNFDLVFSISYTTRPKKPQEQDGKDYFFVSTEKFVKMIKQKGFVEWAKVHNHYYGTPKKNIFDIINKGKNVLLDIDVQGGKNIKKMFPDSVLIFVLPPSWQELKHRIINRKRDTDKEISLRLKNAVKELKYLKFYDYLVINDSLENTVETISKIISISKFIIKNYH
ncbi:MAG: guanylate kinase [Endomicrobia bacterium]|nr:guanylate kinase [Endomicrobiia bacterium]